MALHVPVCIEQIIKTIQPTTPTQLEGITLAFPNHSKQYQGRARNIQSMNSKCGKFPVLHPLHRCIQWESLTLGGKKARRDERDPMTCSPLIMLPPYLTHSLLLIGYHWIHQCKATGDLKFLSKNTHEKMRIFLSNCIGFVCCSKSQVTSKSKQTQYPENPLEFTKYTAAKHRLNKQKK